MIAARSDPVPASFVVETVKVARGDESLRMACSPSTKDDEIVDSVGVQAQR
ncbi:MAG: hypothetical protein IPF53_15820 [Blastocatellia bacterium]|nr:hypothetical protein [Blastocatellia bacterium]